LKKEKTSVTVLPF